MLLTIKSKVLVDTEPSERVYYFDLDNILYIVKNYRVWEGEKEYFIDIHLKGGEYFPFSENGLINYTIDQIINRYKQYVTSKVVNRNQEKIQEVVWQQKK